MKKLIAIAVLMLSIVGVGFALPSDTYCHREGVFVTNHISQFDDMYRDICEFSDGTVSVTEVVGTSYYHNWYTARQWKAQEAKEARAIEKNEAAEKAARDKAAADEQAEVNAVQKAGMPSGSYRSDDCPSGTP